MRRTIIHALQSAILGQLVGGGDDEHQSPDTNNVNLENNNGHNNFTQAQSSSCGGDDDDGPIVKRLRSGTGGVEGEKKQEMETNTEPTLEIPDVNTPIQVMVNGSGSQNVKMSRINRNTSDWWISLQSGDKNGGDDNINRDIKEYDYGESCQLLTDKDPLDDGIYESLHKRMEKREISAKIRERENTAFEIHRQSTQLSALKGDEWMRSVPDHPNLHLDQAQMKRLALIKEIESNLSKYNQFKSKERQLKHHANRPTYGTSTPKSVYLSVLQKHQRFPNLSPKHVAVTPSPSRQQQDKTSANTKTVSLHRTPFKSFFKSSTQRDMFVKRMDRVGIRRKLYAFGVQIPEIPHRAFDIPTQWKRQAK